MALWVVLRFADDHASIEPEHRRERILPTMSLQHARARRGAREHELQHLCMRWSAYASHPMTIVFGLHGGALMHCTGRSATVFGYDWFHRSPPESAVLEP